MKQNKLCKNCIHGRSSSVISDLMCSFKGIVDSEYVCSRYRSKPGQKDKVLTLKNAESCQYFSEYKILTKYKCKHKAKLSFNFLLSPWVVIASMIIGIILGMYYENYAKLIEPVGEIYISLLEMIATVMLPTAIISSIGRLMKSREAASYLRKITVILVIFMLGISTISVITGFATKTVTGADFETKKAVGKMMVDREKDDANVFVKEISSLNYEKKADGNWFIKFVINVIPANIFSALIKGDTLKIIFFSLLLGVMMKFISDKLSDNMLTIIEGFFETVNKLIDVVMYLLPFGLCSLMAVQFRGLTLSSLASLVKFIVFVYIISIVLFLISSLVIWRCSGGRYLSQFAALKDTLIVAFVTSDSFAALPTTYSGLEKMKLDKSRTNLVISLCLVLCEFGTIISFSAASFFTVGLYNYSLNIETVIIIIVISIVASIATLGIPEIVATGMVALVLTPLGLPASATILVLTVLSPILSPVLTLIDVYITCAAVAVTAGSKRTKNVRLGGEVV